MRNLFYNMPDYKEGKIYKLKCKETFEVYIGSTIQKMCDRISTHVHKSNTSVSKQIIERGNYEFELIENFPCDTARELHAREQYWIDNTENTINKQRQYESEEAFKAHRKEYQKKLGEAYRNGDKREEYLNKKRQYREKNRDAVRAKQSEVIQCECGGTYTRSHKSTHCKSKKHLDNLPA
jgi:hypothetical protein|tara:strand:+ start:41 stop:580 length:540 start_codon:yes stop_codon:yes gene_type:complete